MSRNLTEVETEALQLDPKERALLAERLITSLDREDEGDIEAAWIEEAEHRYRAYREGKLQSRPAADVIRDTRSKLP